MTLRIKEILQEKGVTSVMLSEKINVSKVSISYILNGKQKPSYDTLEKIAEALNVPMWQLFASLEEVKEQSGVHVCPHCGGLLDVNVSIDKKR